MQVSGRRPGRLGGRCAPSAFPRTATDGPRCGCRGLTSGDELSMFRCAARANWGFPAGVLAFIDSRGNVTGTFTSAGTALAGCRAYGRPMTLQIPCDGRHRGLRLSQAGTGELPVELDGPESVAAAQRVVDRRERDIGRLVLRCHLKTAGQSRWREDTLGDAGWIDAEVADQVIDPALQARELFRVVELHARHRREGRGIPSRISARPRRRRWPSRPAAGLPPFAQPACQEHVCVFAIRPRDPYLLAWAP